MILIEFLYYDDNIKLTYLYYLTISQIAININNAKNSKIYKCLDLGYK